MAPPLFKRKPPATRWSSRLALELFVIVIAKLAALSLLWWIAFSPYPRPARGHDAIERLLAPNSATPSIHESTP